MFAFGCNSFAKLLPNPKNVYKKDSAWISKSKLNTIEITSTTLDNPLPGMTMPVSGFVVKDVRSDTTYVGVKIVNYGWNANKGYKKLNFENGTVATLTPFLNSKLGLSFSGGAVVLTCFLKQLRITEVDSVHKLKNDKKLYHRLRFEAEGYFNSSERYYPALRLDTTMVSFADNKNKVAVIRELLAAFAAKAAAADVAKILKRTGYSIEELDKRYKQRFYKPILQATQLNEGVYKSFAEFINNNPSVGQYEFKKDKKATILYTKTGGNDWFPDRKVFGFCDGKVIWINVDNTFHPLIRQGNTFEFLVDYYTVNNRGSGTGNYIYRSRSGLIAGNIPYGNSNPKFNQ